MDRHELERVADQYRADGYDVTIEPRGTELPEFLRRYQVDLLARRGSEHVVVEVKRREDVQSEDETAYLAAEVNARPGWRFDLFLTNGSPWPDPVSPDSAEADQHRIRTLADSAERLLSQGELEASCLVAWSAVEASLRDLARRHSIELHQKGPQFVLEALTTEGVLDRDEFESLERALRTRNALAHGLFDPGLTSATPRDLVEVARRMLDLELAGSEA